MLTHIGQHDFLHDGKVGVNEAAGVVNSDNLHLDVLPTLILRRALLRNILGHHAVYEINLSLSPLRCCNGSLGNLLSPTTLSLPISVIIQNYLCTIFGSNCRRVISDSYSSMKKISSLEASICTRNSGSLRGFETIWMSVCRLVPLSNQNNF